MTRQPHSSWIAILSDPVRLGIFLALCELGQPTIAELGQHCHTSDRTVRRHLESLRALGIVREHPGRRDGMTPGRPAGRFSLDGEVAHRAEALRAALSEPLVPGAEPR